MQASSPHTGAAAVVGAKLEPNFTDVFDSPMGNAPEENVSVDTKQAIPVWYDAFFDGGEFQPTFCCP